MILTYLDQDRNKIADANFETLTLARQLAEQSNAPLHAILIGDPPPDLTPRLAAFGVNTLHIAKHDALTDYAPAGYAQSIVELINTHKPNAVLALGTERGNEILAHVAARTNLPMAANCTQVQIGEPYTVTRFRWGGSLLEEAKLNGATKLLTVAPNSIPAAPALNAQDITFNPFTPTLTDQDLITRVQSRVETSSGKVSLAEARVVVGGGRGVGSAEGFRELEELADLLGGAVGGSRVVTGLGWRPHHDQIGQTGTRISPELYISCGVSGAIQHMVGAKGAKHILAINTDPDAPIMFKADYAVIGDLHQIVPAITAEIKKRRAQK